MRAEHGREKVRVTVVVPMWSDDCILRSDLPLTDQLPELLRRYKQAVADLQVEDLLVQRSAGYSGSAEVDKSLPPAESGVVQGEVLHILHGTSQQSRNLPPTPRWLADLQTVERPRDTAGWLRKFAMGIATPSQSFVSPAPAPVSPAPAPVDPPPGPADPASRAASVWLSGGSEAASRAQQALSEAWSRWAGGQHREALAELGMALPEHISALGGDHPDMLRARHFHAYWRASLGFAGVAAAAAEEFKWLLADETRVLGDKHDDTTHTRQSLEVINAVLRWIPNGLIPQF